MVDAQPRQRPQRVLVLRQIRRVDLGVPAGELVHAQREVEIERAAAAQVEAHGADAGGVERADLVVAHRRRELRDADVPGPSAASAASSHVWSKPWNDPATTAPPVNPSPAVSAR